MSVLRFPDGFLWGAATSAHQVEGGNDNNDWWEFERAGRVVRGEVSGLACDHWRRYPSDFDIAASLGHSAHRFSVEWSRIEPEEGRFDETALDHYAAVVAALRERGMRPFVALFHFTLPLWFARSGGWARRDAPALFERFSRRVIARLHPWVRDWLTINEPANYVHLGYRAAYWPPEHKDLLGAHRASTHLAQAHRLVYDAAHELQAEASVGFPVSTTALRRPEDPIEVALRPWAHWLANDWFLDRTRRHLDFVGIQYYSRFKTRELLPWNVPGELTSHERGLRTEMGWEVYPAGLGDTVLHAWRRFRKPIVVTENGVAVADDRRRALFIRDHLAALHGAIERGAHVLGYCYWSLLDNFEWREGFAKRFGLVEVDFETQARAIRPSARYFERICRTNLLDPAEDVSPYYERPPSDAVASQAVEA